MKNCFKKITFDCCIYLFSRRALGNNLKNLFKGDCAFQIEQELEVLVVEDSGKPESLRKGENKLQTKPTNGVARI